MTTIAEFEARLTALLAEVRSGVGVSLASVNPDGTAGHVAAGELIEASWGSAVADHPPPKLLGFTPTTTTTTAFSIPAETSDVARLWVITWSWWSYDNNANGTMVIQLKYAGGATIGSYSIPFASSAAPVPTLSGTSHFSVPQAASGGAISLEAIISGGTGPWLAQGYLFGIGFSY